jgi:hypothetical protein
MSAFKQLPAKTDLLVPPNENEGYQQVRKVHQRERNPGFRKDRPMGSRLRGAEPTERTG